MERRYIGLDKRSSAVAVTVRVAKCARKYSEQRTGGKNQSVMLVALLREVPNSIPPLPCVLRGFILSPTGKYRGVTLLQATNTTTGLSGRA